MMSAIIGIHLSLASLKLSQDDSARAFLRSREEMAVMRESAERAKQSSGKREYQYLPEDPSVSIMIARDE